MLILNTNHQQFRAMVHKFSCQGPERAYDTLNAVYISRVQSVLSLQLIFLCKKVSKNYVTYDKMEAVSVHQLV